LRAFQPVPTSAFPPAVATIIDVRPGYLLLNLENVPVQDSPVKIARLDMKEYNG
jgi:hypothetical protein